MESFDWYNKEPAKNYTLTATVSGAETYEYVEIGRINGNCEVFLNGEKIGANPWMHRNDNFSVRPFRFYCNFKKGKNELKIHVATNGDFLGCISGYVKLGKNVNEKPWRVPLHYGLARVFVRGGNEAEVKAKIVE